MTLTINGYTLPPEVQNNQSPLAQWVAAKSPTQLKKIDCGDRWIPKSPLAHPQNQTLEAIEIFQALAHEYEQATKKAFISRFVGDVDQWHTQLQARDRCAQMIRELNWEPVFHISDRAYLERIATLLDPSLFEKPRSDPFTVAGQLYQKGFPPWEQGGLCFAYPEGYQQTVVDAKGPITGERAAKACIAGDLTQWGSCSSTTGRIATQMVGALALCVGVAAKPLWFRVSPIRPPLDQGFEMASTSSFSHAFLALRNRNKDFLPLDPSNIGFNLVKTSTYKAMDIWRGSLVTFYYNLGVYEQGKGHLEVAADAYEEVITLAPDFVEAYVNLGAIRAAQNKTSQAEELFKQAMKLDPKFVEAPFNLGILYKRQGLQALAGPAETHLRLAIQLEPNFAPAYLELADLLAAQGRNLEAAEFYFRVGVLFMDYGQMDLTQVAFQMALIANPAYRAAEELLQQF